MTHSDSLSCLPLKYSTTLSSLSECPQFLDFIFPVLAPKKAKKIKISSTMHRDDGSFICFVDNTTLAAYRVYK